MKTRVSILLVSILLLTACATGINSPIGMQPTATVQAQPTYTQLPTYTPYPSATPDINATVDAAVKATANAVAVLPTAVPTHFVPTAVPASGQTITCDGNTLRVPTNGQVFPSTTWVNNQPQHDLCYDTVYDPTQSGVNYLPAKGWWYQPLLPGPHKVYFETALILQAGVYKYLGPECTVYLNTSGNDSTAGKNGQVIVNRQNIEELMVNKTAGAPGNESWIFVVCQESDAGGFSFALR